MEQPLDSEDQTARTTPLRRVAAAALVLVGVEVWLIVGRGMYGTTLQLKLLVVAAGATLLAWLIPAIRTGVSSVVRAARSPSPRAAALTAVVLAVAATVYFCATAIGQRRPLFPRWHDDFMYLLQTRMVASGRLWTAPHPLADAFESFHVLVKPVYAAIYFPGTAILYAPSVWLGLPHWVLPLCVAGATVGLTYWVMTHLVDGIAGALAALIVLSNVTFRYLSVLVMSHLPMAMLGVALVGGWLMWRRRGRRPGWALCLGVVAGWAAITRPADALCYTIPVVVAVLLDLRHAPWRRRLLTVGCACAGAAPLFALQVAFNWNVTGDPFTTPYKLASDLSLGFHSDPKPPASELPQMRAYYETFTVPAARAHRPEAALPTLLNERLPRIARYGLTGELLLVFTPAAVLALRSRRWVLAAPVPLFLALYALFPYLLPHYVGAYVPVIAYVVVLGARGLADAAGRWRDAVTCFAALAIGGFCLAALPQVDPLVADDVLVADTMNAVAELPRHVTPPAIVLFKYNEGDDPNQEPVYNVDVVRPDDAPIIRAHDLGPAKNAELFRYYAERQPQRTVYRFDRRDNSLTRLGNVADLARGGLP